MKKNIVYVIFRYVFLLLTILCLLGTFLGIILLIGEGNILGIFIGGICGVLCLLFDKITRNMSYKFCAKCRSVMDGCAYEYRSKKSFDVKSNNELSKRKVEVEIKATCPECGKIKKFKEAFVSYNYKTGENYNVGSLVDDFCERKFGH